MAWVYFKNTPPNPKFIAHHGIKGQKWGIRRFQNPDGSLTAEGMARYGINSKDPNRSGDLKTRTKALRKASNKAHQTLRYNDYEGNTPEYQLIDNALKEVYGEDAYKNYEKQKKRRTVLAIAAITAAAVTAIGGPVIYKYAKKGKEISDETIEDIEDEKVSSESDNIDPEMERIIKSKKMWDQMGEKAAAERDAAEKEMQSDPVKYAPFGSTIMSKDEYNERARKAEEAILKEKRTKEVQNKYRNEINNIVREKQAKAKKEYGLTDNDIKKVKDTRKRVINEVYDDYEKHGLTSKAYKDDIQKTIRESLNSEFERNDLYEKERNLRFYENDSRHFYDEAVSEILKNKELERAKNG